MPPVHLEQCDEGSISSALAAPQTSFGGEEKYPTLPAKTAALLYALAKSQACPDGNKRIALILVLEFLALNGHTVETDPDDLAEIILTAAESNPGDRDAVVIA